MSVSATITMGMQVTESVSVDAAGYLKANNSSVIYNGSVVSATRNATSDPDITVHAVGKQALTAGAATIDLTVLTGVNGVAVSLSGLKPVSVFFHNAGANSMTIAKGASNGYTGFGSAATFTLAPGEKVQFFPDANGTAVSGSVKTLDLTGTGSQELKYEIVAGA